MYSIRYISTPRYFAKVLTYLESMFTLLLWVQIFPQITALQQDSFVRGFYHFKSINSIEDPEHEPNLAPYACAGYCLKQSTCGGYSVQSKLNCIFLETTEIPKLIKSSKNGKKSREVWIKESLLSGGLTPHLLVISGNGKLQDISLDPDTSPSIDYGIEVPVTGNKIPGPYVVDHDLSMLMMKPGKQEFLSWNFDDQTPTTVPNANLPTSGHRASTAFQNGRLYFTRHLKSFTIVNRKMVPLKDFPIQTTNGCAAFVPGDDDTVYIIGGLDAGNGNAYKKFVYTYQFSTNDYVDLEKDVQVSGGIARHACVGVETPTGEKLVVVIGGTEDNDEKSDSVRTFNVETKQWGLWPAYPMPIDWPRAIFANGYIYSAGGKDAEGEFVKKIFKMKASSDGSWEEFADMDEESESPYLILYNN